jgi:hypothetical protein
MFSQNNIIKYLNKNNKILQHDNCTTYKTDIYYSTYLQLKHILFEEKYPGLSFCDLKKTT